MSAHKFDSADDYGDHLNPKAAAYRKFCERDGAIEAILLKHIDETEVSLWNDYYAQTVSIITALYRSPVRHASLIEWRDRVRVCDDDLYAVNSQPALTYLLFNNAAILGLGAQADEYRTMVFSVADDWQWVYDKWEENYYRDDD